MTETDWMYDSLTERFGETLGDRQKVVDALLIAKAIVGDRALESGDPEVLLSVAWFILDEWGKHSNAEDSEDPEESGEPVVLDISAITEADISLMKYGSHTFPEGSRWRNFYGTDLIFTEGDFWVEDLMLKASVSSHALPFLRIDKEN